MKRSTRDISVIKTEQGQIMGVNLGWDFSAEHELGFQRFTRLMRIGEVPNTLEARKMLKAIGLKSGFFSSSTMPSVGIESRIATDIPDSMLLLKEYDNTTKTLDAETRLIFSKEPEEFEGRTSQMINHYVPHRKQSADATPPDMKVAWRDGRFLVRAFSDEDRDALRLVHKAMLAGDLAFGSAANLNPMGNNGPAMVVVSLMSDAMKAEVLKADVAHQKLQKAAEDTGIHKKLEKAGKEYVALNAGWKEEGSDEVIFFLNPIAKYKYNHGWFTVKDLEDWCKDKGPVMGETS